MATLEEEAAISEMAVLTSNVDDDEIEQETRYSSSDVIAAARDITFKQQQKAEKVEREVKAGKITATEAQEELRKAYTTIAHTLDKMELAKEYETDLNNGLTNKQIEEREAKYGKNELSPAYREPWYKKLARFIFGGFFNQLLLFGALLCFVAYALAPYSPSN
ncbi:hypothetical protein RFI_34987, partial [Reticulomyxa filosa]